MSTPGLSDNQGLEQAVEHVARSTEDLLDALLANPAGPEAPLLDAMRYATLGGGKRLRPFLVMASADLFSVATPFALRVAAAVEMVHTYSLLHDDLPCMDDDDLRRGRPAAHVKFGEAIALLAGDALQSLAFEVLAAPATHPSAEVRAELVRALAAAIGPQGMAGGQAIDLAGATAATNFGAVTRLQQLKTGALIGFCCEAGALLGHADTGPRHALKAYAHDFGLAFQIADDLLDHEGSVAELGKRVGKDAAAGKATLVTLMGPEQARRQAAALARQAGEHLEGFGRKANLLRALAEFAINRRS